MFGDGDLKSYHMEKGDLPCAVSRRRILNNRRKLKGARI